MDTFQHYKVNRREDGTLFELGRGAMGITYKASDTILGRDVALKVINAQYFDSEVARERFKREAQAAARIIQENVATVYQLGLEGDTFFYAMEFVRGETVDHWLKTKGPMTPRLASNVTIQGCRALAAANRENLVHRDIKPANIMIIEDEDEVRVKVIDFGLAKNVLKTDDAPTLTMAGFVGTPHFASPEQLEERDLDIRSDIYSLGVTLWYMLAGQAPFAGTFASLLMQHLNAPPPLEKLQGQPKEMIEVLKKSLEKDRDFRFQTPSEFRVALEACLDKWEGVALKTAVAVGEPLGEDFATMAMTEGVAGGVGAPVALAKGVTLANRYELESDAPDPKPGTLVPGRKLATGEKVSIYLAAMQQGGLSLDPHFVAAIEARKLITDEHLAAVREVFSDEFHVFVACERITGFVLGDALRQRGQFSPQETVSLVGGIARTMENLRDQPAALPRLSPDEVYVHFIHNTVLEEVANLPRRSVRDWFQWQIKILGFPPAIHTSSAPTWQGGATMVAPMPGSRSPHPVRDLGLLAYELIHGSPHQARAGSYSPTPNIGAEGNAILKRAIMQQPGGYTGPMEFWNAFSAAVPPDVIAPSTANAFPPPMPPLRASEVPATSVPPPAAPSPRSSSMLPIAALLIVMAMLAAAAGGGIWWILRDKKSEPRVDLTDPRSGDETPQPSPVASATPEPTPEPTPTPTPAPTPTPTPELSPEEKFALAFDELRQSERDKTLPEMVESYLELASDYPAQRRPLERLNALFGEITAETILLDVKPPVREDLRPSAERAADEGVVNAMLYLGDGLIRQEPLEAVRWFTKAATNDEPHAMVQLGLLYSNGAPGVPKDARQAGRLLMRSAELGSVSGKYFLAECLLSPSDNYGTGYNPGWAAFLLTEAAESGDLRAMTQLGVLNDKGVGVARDSAAAYLWLDRAHKRGHTPATTQLGVLYITGRGVEKADPVRAAELFRESMDKGDLFAKAFYANCLYDGTGVARDQATAKKLLAEAAAAGNPVAINRCKELRIRF